MHGTPNLTAAALPENCTGPGLPNCFVCRGAPRANELCWQLGAADPRHGAPPHGFPWGHDYPAFNQAWYP